MWPGDSDVWLVVAAIAAMILAAAGLSLLAIWVVS
jgi:hypothetical protein